MEKTITTKEAVALLNVLNAFPCDFLDNAAFIQHYTTFRIAVRDILKKTMDKVVAEEKKMSEKLKPLQEESGVLANAKAEIDSKAELTDDEKALSDKYTAQLQALEVRGKFIIKDYNEFFDKLIETEGSKKLLLTCNEEDYGKVKAKILDKAKDIFVIGGEQKMFDVNRYEIILNIFK